MFRSWRLGKAFGIPLYLHPTLLLLPALVLCTEWGDGWFNALLMTALLGAVFGCVLLHELGHALTARAFGIRTRDITLYPIGGVASLERMAEAPLQEMAIAFAGPAVNLVIVGLLLPATAYAVLSGLLQGDATTFHLDDGLAGLAAKFAFVLMACNGGLIVFNLLPAFPMDGGRVFRGFLALMVNRLLATEIAAAVGLGLAGLFVLAGLASIFVPGVGTPVLALIGLFVAFAGRMELLSVRREADRVAPSEPSYSYAETADAADGGDAPPTPNFSGFRWDRRDRVWVLWRNGQPIEVYEGGAE